MSNYEKFFAANLRRLRKAAGMTQAQLGSAIGYSEKSVSKWECAAGIPDVDGLFALSKTLCVSMEALFADDSKVYFLGIDGGGTKTSLMLADCEGNTLRKLYVGASNPMDIGLDQCTKVLQEAICEICEGIPLSSVVVYAGIAGCTSVKDQLQDFFRSLPIRMFDCDSDNTNFMQAALGDGDGVTVILGTGICAWARRGGETYRTGGWGYLINEGGCAFDIGQDALKVYYSYVDGMAEQSALTEAIGKLYADNTALLRQVYSGGKKWIASLAPLVFNAAQQGDSAAEAILNRNMSVAAQVMETAAKRFPVGPVKVVITGGLTNQPCVTQYLLNAMQNPKHIQLSVLADEPVAGAVTLAKKLWEQTK